MAVDPDILHRRAIRAESVGDDGLGSAVALHRALERGERRLAIAAFYGKDLQHLALMIDSAPEIVRLAVNPHEDLVQVPTPLWHGAEVFCPPASDLGVESWAEAVPPKPHGLVADIDLSLKQKIFDLTQQERIADVKQYRGPEDLQSAAETTESILHLSRLRIAMGLPKAR